MTKEYLEALNKIQHDFGQLKGQELVSCYETIFNALKRLESIDNANPSEALEIFNKADNIRLLFTKEEKSTIKQALIQAEMDRKLKVDICEMFGLDNLFPYTDNEAILKGLEEYMDNKNELWVKYMKKSKKEQAWDIVVKKNVDVSLIKKYDFVEDYNSAVWIAGRPKLVKEEFDTLKEVLE